MKNTRWLAAAAFASVLGTAVLGLNMTALAATGWVQNGSNYVYYDVQRILLHGSFLWCDERRLEEDQ